MMPVILFLLSIGLQLAAAIYALLLIRVTGRKLAWVLISFAMVLMASRRIASFASIIISGEKMIFDFPELIALAISCLMLAGVLLIRNYFRDIDAVRADHRQVEKFMFEMERKYKNLFDSSADGIYITDAKGVFTLINQAGAEYFGFKTPEDVIGKTAAEFWLNPADRDAFVAELKKKKRVRAYPAPGKRANGEITDAELTSWIIEDEDGSFLGIEGIVRDVTERKKAERELRQSEARYRNLIETAPVVIYTLSAENGIITSLNPAFEKITGWPCEEWLGKSFMPIIHPDDLPRAVDIYQRVLGGETPPPYELLVLSKSGGYLVGEFTSAPVMEGGKVTGEFGIVSDITAREKMEKEILQITSDWEDTFDTITDMITVHDKDFNIIRANKAAKEKLGLAFLDRLSCEKCFKYYHGTERPPEGCPSCNCLVTGEAATFELFEPNLNMFIEIRAIPRFDHNNQLIGLIHVVRDISERRKAAEDLDKAFSLLSATLESTADGILVVDAEGKINSHNQRFIDMWRIPQHVIDSRDDNQALAFVLKQLKEPDKFLKKVRELYAEPGAESFDILEFEDGRVFERYSKPQMVYGKNAGRVWSFRDITETKKAEEELKERIEELERFYEMAVGRELKMKEMKEEIIALKDEISRCKQGRG